VYYKIEELPQIKEWLDKNYSTNVKTVSFLLHSDHGFMQAPLEEITEEEYYSRMLTLSSIASVSIKESDMTVSECESGACPVK
jgi:hypothetical protein